MIKKKFIVAFLVVIGCFLFGLAKTPGVEAVTCSGLNKTLVTGGEIRSNYNSSLKTACDKFEADQTNLRGSMWINANSSTDSEADAKSAYALVAVAGNITSTSYVNVYIHGAIIGGYNYGGDSGNAATHVKFVKTNDIIYGSAEDYSAYAPLSVSGDFTVSRPVNTTTSDIKSGVYGPVKLKIGEIINNASYYNKKTKITSGAYAGYTAYEISLQAFRCYGPTTPYYNSSTDYNDSCYSDPTTIVILAKTSTSATVTGSTSVLKVGNNDVSDSTYGYNYNSGATRSYDVGTNTSSATVTFRNALSTSDSKTYTTQYAYRFWYSDSGYDETHWSSPYTSKSVPGNVDLTGKSVSLGYGETKTVCLQFWFYNNVVSDGTFSGGAYLPSSSDWRCINLYRPKPTYSLNIYARNVADDSGISSGNQTITGYGPVTATRSNISGYKFVCWKNSPSSGTGGCVENGISRSTNLSGNTTWYAYYAKAYTLTATADGHSTVSVNRTSTITHDGVGKGTLVNVKNGTATATIYWGDVLSGPSYSYDGCQSNGNDWAKSSESVAGSMNPVNGNVTVKVSSQDRGKYLTVYYKNTQFGDISSSKATKVCYNGSVTSKRLTISNYNFVGWRDSSWSGGATSYCSASSCANSTLTGLNTSSDVTNLAYSYDYYTRKNITGNTSIYAVYSYKYTSTKDIGPGTGITVKRTDSPYAKAGTGDLGSGALIYNGDVLEISYSTNNCSNWATHTVNSANWNSGAKYTVNNGNVTTVTRANLREYTLTKSRATGSTLTVTRKSSPWTDKNITTTNGKTLSSKASTGNIENGAAIYCGDTISASFGLNTGYSWGNYGWSGNGHTWGYHFQSNNTGKSGNSWNVTGPDSATEHDGYSSQVYTLDDNVTAETQAVLDKFEGRARVDGGTSISNNASSTGYTSANKETTKKIDCVNEGCDVAFDLWARTTQGTGVMKYSLGSSNKLSSGGLSNIVWVPGLSNLAPVNPAQANVGNGGTRLLNTSTTIKPGYGTCRYLTFTPLGTSNSRVDVSACINAAESLFEGQVSVSGKINGTSGWMNTTTGKDTNVFYADNCDNGCAVSFKHEMKRTSGIGWIGYTVERESNLTSTARGISNGTVSPNDAKFLRGNTGIGTNNSPQTVATDGIYTLYPGMKVCETLTFKPSNNDLNKREDVAVTTCALALGKAQPDDDPDPNNPSDPRYDPSGDNGRNALIDIEAKSCEGYPSSCIGNYNTYRRIVYTKPNDTVIYRASYNPLLQYTYYLKPQRIQINGGTSYPTIGYNTNSLLGALYNSYKNSDSNKNKGYLNWNNGFSVLRMLNSEFDDNNEFSNPTSKWPYLSSIGVINNSQKTNSILIEGGHVGQTIDEQAIINWSKTTNTKTTPVQVTFTCTNRDGNRCKGYNSGNIDVQTQKRSETYVRVPYNFNITTDITTPEDKPVSAGESMTIEYDVSVGNKPNCETAKNCGEYATKVDDVLRKVVVYEPETVDVRPGGIMPGGRTADICSGYFYQANDEINCGYAHLNNKTEGVENWTPGAHNGQEVTFYAKDLEAGKKVCVAVAIFPASSGADTNWNDKNYSNSWRISDSKCYTIAKKPSLQVWGGNLYSTGNLSTAISEKSVVSGLNEERYKVAEGTGTKYAFGSWGELGIVSVGSVGGIASGAATGYALNYGDSSLLPNNMLWPSHVANDTMDARLKSAGPGGSTKTSLCRRSPLTFANVCVSTVSVSGMQGSMLSSNGARDKSSIITKYMTGGEWNTVNSGDTLSIGGDAGGNYTSTGSFSVSGWTNGGTYAIKSTNGEGQATGNITINGNIEYIGAYTTVSTIPRVIIYAKNINIACNVTRIDAILIAEDTVTTCSNSDNINRPENSTQLKINGTIITDKLVANRTYGAAAGANSIIPAEIINYDATLYLWGSRESTADSTGKFNVTYTRELSPRY